MQSVNVSMSCTGCGALGVGIVTVRQVTVGGKRNDVKSTALPDDWGSRARRIAGTSVEDCYCGKCRGFLSTGKAVMLSDGVVQLKEERDAR